MSNYNQTRPQGQAAGASYPAPAVEVYGQPGGAYMVPPPAGYPMKEGQPASSVDTTTTSTHQSRGDGFWKGCCAALCCCCVLDACF